MSFWSDFGRGITAHGTALKFVAKHKLWIYFLVPLILSIVLLSVGFVTLWNVGGIVRDHVMEFLLPKIENEDGGVLLAIGASILATLIGIVFQFIVFILVLKIMRYLVLILISPVLALVSERVDEIITGKKYPFVFSHFLHDVFRGITVSLRNMLFETLIFLATLLVCWVPVLNLLIPPFLMLIGWYFLGFNMMDYTYERRRMKISEGKHFTRKHKGLAMGNGLVYSMFLYIPVVGFAFGPVLSVIAGTIATLEQLEGKKITV
jgi:CysZ protein